MDRLLPLPMHTLPARISGCQQELKYLKVKGITCGGIGNGGHEYKVGMGVME